MEGTDHHGWEGMGAEAGGAGHMMSAVRKQREMNSHVPFAFPSCSVPGHNPGTDPLSLGVGLPNSGTLLGKLPDRHNQTIFP